MPPKRRRSSRATKPPPHELVNRILDDDKSAPRRQSPRTRSRRHSPPVEQRDDHVPAQDPLLDAGQDTPGDSVLARPVEQDDNQLTPKPWSTKINIIGALCVLVIAFSATIIFYQASAKSALRPDETKLHDATAHIAHVKEHIHDIQDISTTAVINASLDETLRFIRKAKPYLATISEELTQLDPQLARAVSRRKGLSCSLLRPIHLRISRASQTCKSASDALQGSKSASEKTDAVIAAAKKRYDNEYLAEYQKNLSKTFWRLLPSWSWSPGEAKSEELTSVARALDAAWRASRNATKDLAEVFDTWDHACRQFTKLDNTAKSLLHKSTSADCMNNPALSSAQSNISGIVAQVIANPIRD